MSWPNPKVEISLWTLTRLPWVRHSISPGAQEAANSCLTPGMCLMAVSGRHRPELRATARRTLPPFVTCNPKWSLGLWGSRVLTLFYPQPFLIGRIPVKLQEEEVQPCNTDSYYTLGCRGYKRTLNCPKEPHPWVTLISLSYCKSCPNCISWVWMPSPSMGSDRVVITWVPISKGALKL